MSTKLHYPAEQNGAIDEGPYPNYLKAELGLRNNWYAAIFGTEIAEGNCRGEMIMGERILF